MQRPGLEGYENVEIHLSNEGDNIKEPSSLKLDLKIESFPNFEKTGTGINVQEYIIQCVTHVATRSKQQRISLALGGTDNSATVESILQIFKEYLGVEPDSIQGWDEAEKNTGLPWQGVITYMTPLQAIDLIRRQAFSSQGGAPLMIFPILGEKITEDGKLKFKMGYLDDILDGPIYEPTDKSYYAYNERTDLKVSDLGYIDFLKRQILGISSDMKLNKLEDARAGRYGSKVSITDYANKIYKADLYIGNGIWPPVLDGGSELPSIGPDGNPESYRDPPSLDIDKPETIASSSRRFINTGLPKTNTGIPSSDFIQSQVAAREKFWYSSLNHKHVDFTVHGDFELNVGTHVEIKVPIAADLAEFGQGGLQDFDPLLSGIYMITMVTHTFANGKFTTTLKTIQTPEMYVNASSSEWCGW